MDSQNIQSLVRHNGSRGAGSAGVEVLAVQIGQGFDAGILRHENLDGGGLVIPKNPHIGKGVAGESASGSGIALIVGVGDAVGDGHLAHTQFLGIRHISARLRHGDLQLGYVGKDIADRHAVGEQSGARRHSGQGQVTGLHTLGLLRGASAPACGRLAL